jgi:hypothetical protein
MYALRICIFLLLICAGLKSHAQYSDVQGWTSLYVEKRIVKGLNLHFEGQSRANQYVSNIYYGSLDVGLTLKPVKWINFSAAYVITGKELRTGGINFRNQYYANALVKLKFGFFRVNNRFMVQSKNNDSYLATDAIQDRNNYFRDKLSLKLDITRRVTPFVSQEFYWELSDPRGNDISRSRSAAGVEFLITKGSQLELFYMLQKELHQRRPENAHVIGVGYEIYLK